MTPANMGNVILSSAMDPGLRRDDDSCDATVHRPIVVRGSPPSARMTNSRRGWRMVGEDGEWSAITTFGMTTLDEFAVPNATSDVDESLRQCVIDMNHVPIIGPRGPRRFAGGVAPGAGAGAGPYSGVNAYAMCVASSTVIVLAPA